MYWKFASLAIFFIFAAWCFIEIKIKTRKEEEREAAFWEREATANSVRRKPIDHLDYIYVPKDLPLELTKDHPEMPSILHTLDSLRGQKILNLTGYSNTDLKLMYGAPNITALSQYDQNYTALVTTLQKWADILTEEGYKDEAIKVMEYLVSTKADIGKTYRILGSYYLNNGYEDKYEELIKQAESLTSLNKPYIVRSVKDLR